jgi:hypothetical protein
MSEMIRFEGMDELRRKLAAAGPLALQALAAGMVEEQEQVITAAKQRTPVDTGTLKGSGTVLPPKFSGSRAEVVAGFGGAAQDYAIVVHEDLSASHPVGEAKFLERSFLERANGMGRNLAAHIGAALKRLSI